MMSEKQKKKKKAQGRPQHTGMLERWHSADPDPLESSGSRNGQVRQ
jgi:hypothetical protein